MAAPNAKRKRRPEDQSSGLKTQKISHSLVRNDPRKSAETKPPEADEANLSKADRKESKRKRRLRDAELSLVENQEVPGSIEDESKKERREKRKAKRAAKARPPDADIVQDMNGLGGMTGYSPTQDRDVTMTLEHRLPKAERKAGKNRLKEAKSNGIESLESSDSYLKSNGIAFEDPSRSTVCSVIDSFAKLPPQAKDVVAPFKHFKKPTPIQAAAWNAAIEGRDVVGVAETGSGKTLAFGVPLINHILASKKTSGAGIYALVVSPTRELAVQIQDQISILAKPHKLHSVCIYGGVPKDPQREDLKTASIVVATPGRLNDFVDEGAAKLNRVSYLVLDEADRMLDKGFEEAIRTIISATPSTDRQTLMFTATWPPSVRTLAATFMRDPVRITIGTDAEGSLRANVRIKQLVEVISPMQKENRLLELLQQHQSGRNKNSRILVFCLYKKEATRVEALLHRKGYRVAGIHGDLSQERRSASLESFKTGTTPLLVATDVAARGLDIPDVKLVLNVTFPLTVEDYVHRIGRTGRAGADGLAMTLFTEHDKPLAGALINVLKAANQEVPADLLNFGTTVKKKAHDSYGAFYRAPTDDAKKATKITFDD